MDLDPVDLLGGLLGGAHGAAHHAGDVQREHVVVGLPGLLVGSEKLAGGGLRRGRQDLGGLEPGKELLIRHVDAVAEGLVTEVDLERHHGEAGPVEKALRRVAGGIQHDGGVLECGSLSSAWARPTMVCSFGARKDRVQGLTTFVEVDFGVGREPRGQLFEPRAARRPTR